MSIAAISNAYQTENFVGAYCTAPLRIYNAWFQNKIQESGNACARTALKICYVVTAIFAYPILGAIALFGTAVNLCLIYKENKVSAENASRRGPRLDEIFGTVGIEPVFEKKIGETEISIVDYCGSSIKNIKSNTIVHLSGCLIEYCKEKSTEQQWASLDRGLRNYFFPNCVRDSSKKRAVALDLARLPKADIEWIGSLGIQNIFYAVVTENTNSLASSLADHRNCSIKPAFSESLELAHEKGIRTLAFMNPMCEWTHSMWKIVMNDAFESIQTVLKKYPNSFDRIELVFSSSHVRYYDRKYNPKLMLAAKMLATFG